MCLTPGPPDQIVFPFPADPTHSLPAQLALPMGTGLEMEAQVSPQ